MSGGELRVAVVGATGAVGTTMLEVLAARRFPAREIVPFASERSAGHELPGGLVVQGLSEETIQGFDVALFSAGGSVSKAWAPRFAAAGAVVVDNSSAFRRDAAVPLVVAEVNPEALDAHRGIVANPNCSTMQLLVALKPLADAAGGVERLVVSTYQATSGTGMRAVQELDTEIKAWDLEIDLWGPNVHWTGPEVYPHPIAFNVIGAAGNFAPGDDTTDEEHKMVFETRKILGDESIRLSVTCTRVPVVTGHCESVNVELRGDLEPDRARAVLEAAPGVTVIDDPSRHSYPTPLAAAGHDDVFVGRIRRDPSNERTLNLWIVADNLRKGAATNAVQLAELLHERHLLGARTDA